VLDDASVDAVELLTPTWLHADQIVAALEAGKHVSCQKPLATTVAEADRIAAAVARARTTFRVTENFLYYPTDLEGQGSCSIAGAIGEPSLVRIHTTRAEHITGQAMELDSRCPGVAPRSPAETRAARSMTTACTSTPTAALWIGEIR